VITINEAAARRMGMTVESVQAVLALSADTALENEVQAWRDNLADVSSPRPTILHTATAIAEYAEMAESLGYAIRH
jgi:hypothetical protein